MSWGFFSYQEPQTQRKYTESHLYCLIFVYLLLDNCWVLNILLLYFNEEKENRNSFHVTICKFSFLHLTATQYSTACIIHTIALKFSGKEHVECFLHFATTNNASIDICIHFPFGSVWELFWVYIQEWEDGSCRICTHNFIDYFQMALQKGYTNLHAH